MIKDIQIRNVKQTDFADIFELLKQLWPNNQLNYQKMQLIFNRNLQSDFKRLICAEYNSKIIGLCTLTIKDCLWQQGFLGYIDELVVDESIRGKGIGTRLVNSIIKIAKAIGCKKIELDSALHREQTHKFYRNLGFETRAYLYSKSLKK